MRSKLLIAISATLLGLGAGWLLGRAPAPKPAERDAGAKATEPTEAKVPLMPPPRKPDFDSSLTPTTQSDLNGLSVNRVEIPLSSIYSTAYQKDLRSLPRKRDEAFTSVCENLDERLHKLHFPTAFLVESTTIYGAVGGTVNVLNGHSKQLFSLRSDLGPDSAWAVLFLGNIRDTIKITVTSALYASGELTVNYHSTDEEGDTTRERVPHIYWIRLPKLMSGGIVLRLHDTATKVDALLVRVTLR